MNYIDEVESALEERAQIGMNPSDDGDPNSSSDRLRQTLRAHDIKGEKEIAAGQAGISCFILALHLLAQFSNNWQSLNLWVIGALVGLIASSALRFFLAKGGSQRERQLDIVTVVDISIFLALIWSYQFAYDHPAGGVLKAPSFMLLTVLVGLRALRFHPRPIIIAGSTAAIGWCLIVLLSLRVDGSAAVTHDYPVYLTSYKILIGAELEKIVALVALTAFLALATLQARRVLSKAASAAYNATEYASALQESERLFSKAFLVSPYPFAILDPEDGTYLRVNEAWLSTMGYSEEEVLGRTALSLEIWADPGHRARFAALVKNEGSVREYHAKVRTKAGADLDTLISAEYVELGGDAWLFIVADDITELKKAEAQRERQHSQILNAKVTLEDTNDQLVQRTEELEAAQETLVERERTYKQIVTALEQSNDLIVLFDPEDQILFANQAWRQLNKVVEWTTKPGIAFEQHLRALTDGGFVPEAIGHEEKWIAERMERHRNPRGPFEVPRQDDKWISVNEQVLEDGSIILIISDITERKKIDTELAEKKEDLQKRLMELGEKNILLDSQREELAAHRDELQTLVDEATAELKERADELSHALNREKELSEQQRQFVAMASHEFRTPLAIIDSTAQRLRKQADNNDLTSADAVQRVQKIRTAVERMTRLMESTLEAARMEDGKISVEIDSCNVVMVLRQVCERQQELAKDHVITYDLTGLPEIIQADYGALEQVFTNLLSNAVKYAPGAPEIEVVGRSKGNYVAISVRDHGLGIDKDDLPKLFGRYFRAKTSAGIAGTGIGLNILKALVEMHNGLISVESTKGEGSVFTVLLPISGPQQAGETITKVA